MAYQDIMQSIQRQLALDYNCSPDDFTKDGFVFTESKENPDRRPFPWFTPRLEMVTFGRGVVVSATDDVQSYIREQLNGKTRDDAFNMPFVHGTALYFLPNTAKITPLQILGEYKFEMTEQPDISSLYSMEGFSNAIGNDENHPRPDMLAVLAKSGDDIIGIAGASVDCELMRQIGIDVLPGHRNKGVAATLVNKLAIEILRRGFIPYYATAGSNIASQRTAIKAGLIPAWTCIYKAWIGGVLTPPLC